MGRLGASSLLKIRHREKAEKPTSGGPENGIRACLVNFRRIGV